MIAILKRQCASQDQNDVVDAGEVGRWDVCVVEDLAFVRRVERILKTCH